MNRSEAGRLGAERAADYRRRVQAFADAAEKREAARSYVWVEPEGDRWKVNPDGVWRWQSSTQRWHFSGWPSAVSQQLLRLAGIA